MKPCKNCGGTDRYPSGGCRPCAIARATKWQKDNRERANAKSKKWKALNREKLRILNPRKIGRQKAKTPEERIERQKACQARYRLSNHEKLLESYRKRKADNPEKEKARLRKWKADHPQEMKAARSAYWAARPNARRIYKNSRRTREIVNGGLLSTNIVDKLFKLQRGKCACCSEPLGSDFHLDHILPVALGGQSADANMQLLRKLCNLKKNAKHPVDYMQERGFLL